MCCTHAGSGYLTACLALLAGPGSHVTGVERFPSLAEVARTNISKSHGSLLQPKAAGRQRLHEAQGAGGSGSSGPEERADASDALAGLLGAADDGGWDSGSGSEDGSGSERTTKRAHPGKLAVLPKPGRPGPVPAAARAAAAGATPPEAAAAAAVAAGDGAAAGAAAASSVPQGGQGAAPADASSAPPRPAAAPTAASIRLVAANVLAAGALAGQGPFDAIHVGAAGQ